MFYIESNKEDEEDVEKNEKALEWKSHCSTAISNMMMLTLFCVWCEKWLLLRFVLLSNCNYYLGNRARNAPAKRKTQGTFHVKPYNCFQIGLGFRAFWDSSSKRLFECLLWTLGIWVFEFGDNFLTNLEPFLEFMRKFGDFELLQMNYRLTWHNPC
jgi:hypothetical protein